MQWAKVLFSNITFGVMTKVTPTSGHLVYEYNPLRNYRLSKNMYEYNNSLYSLEELESKFGITMTEDKTSWLGVTGDEPVLREPGEVVDFITDELSFSLSNPVNILPQYSYDGSVNLILNDGINIPRLINTRFSATGQNTYTVVDRKGDDDTNLYDQGVQFDIDSSLYKRIISIPKIDFLGEQSGGNLKVGNYHFYFKLADADGNETDFVGESGLVSVFIGFSDPSSITTGVETQNSYKSVQFQLSEIDSAYDNVFVYYSRSTAQADESAQTEYVRVDNKFKVNNFGICNINLTGYENSTNITASEINLQYNVVQCAKTQAACQNMLFLGNVKKPDIPYEELSDLSLRFLPLLYDKNYDLDMDENYTVKSSSLGYYDPQYIYTNLGYWDREIYRLGIVYIMPNNELSPVFNIRGANNLGLESAYADIPIYEDDGTRRKVTYNEETFYIQEENTTTLENVKGVVRFTSDKDTNTIHGIKIKVDKDTITELKKYVKGYFFVRQVRLPTVLAQGITIGIDKIARTPTLPTKGGIIDSIKDLDLDKTYIEVDDIDGVNYISEGFMTRYSFYLKAKSSFLKVLSTVLSYAACAASFVPGIGTIASAAISAASFITSTIAEGKFQVAAFVSTLATAAVPAASAISKVATAAATAAKAANLTKVANALGTAAKINKVVKAASGTLSTITQVSNLAQATINTVSLGSQLYSQSQGKSYKGRYTTVPSGYTRKENSNSRILNGEFIDRFILKAPKLNNVQGIICPDYEVYQKHFNQIFTGNKHLVRYTISQGYNYYNYTTGASDSNYFNNNERHFYHNAYYDIDTNLKYTTKIIGVPDNTKCVGIDNIKFRSRAGEAEEAFRYEFIGKEYDDDTNKQNNSDIIRGAFGPYLACNSTSLDPATCVDIMIPEYSEGNIEEYFKIRMDDASTFSAISERIDINRDQEDYAADEGYEYILYRGDCYLCQVTHRVIRNFNDPSAPYNDKIVDEDTWKDHYKPDKTEDYENINLGDVNAVGLGMWVTFRLRSSYNLNIRTLDESWTDEAAMCGHPRGYFPYQPMSTEGVYKTPESQIYNKGFAKSVSERWNFELPDVPHIKNWFGTRIMYSDIHINDAYKNGYRVFQGTHLRDYTREYGEIVKLITLESNLLCVFEHGVALIPVNERAVAGEGAGGNIYINTSNVLPENPKIISDMFGSQWAESILKTPGKTGDGVQYVYGVDTVAKKIWRTDGNSLQCISDFKVQEFLNNNITLGERELTPQIGIRNVKTVYNAYKRDVMFTFYDNTYGFEECVWNLCWNELLEKFITFYSWVPSHMENINNVPFSFNRNTAKWIAKLGVSHADNSFADGITLTNNVVNNDGSVDNTNYTVEYTKQDGTTGTIELNNIEVSDNFVGFLGLSNRTIPSENLAYRIDYTLVRDQFQNYKDYEIKLVRTYTFTEADKAKFVGSEYPIYGLFRKSSSNSKVYSVLSTGLSGPVQDENGGLVYYQAATTNFTEKYYRNIKGHSYADDEANKVKVGDTYVDEEGNSTEITLDYIMEHDLPIYKSKAGKRLMLDRDDMVNPDKIITLLNIKANISLIDTNNTASISEAYYNKKALYDSNTTLVSAGYYQSVVALTNKWNMQFLSTDFWKHGQAGLIDIADDIYPTYWYGEQHPFEFECVVVNDPSVHKIFDNLEIVANKAQPESFHYEVIGESFDFAKDKPNMYYRQEAMKALWQYNGADICYNRNFLKVQTRQQNKSADLVHRYYTRQDTINEIEDYYIHITYPEGHDYRHLSGAEIVYYPNRQEFRLWNHAMAVSMDDLSQDDARSIIASNCKYLEDRWKVTINPILVCYKNEYTRTSNASSLFGTGGKTTWPKSADGSTHLPSFTIYNSPIPDQVLEQSEDGSISFPTVDDEDNALAGIYDTTDANLFDTTNWLSDVSIMNVGASFGEAQNRKEIDLKDKFMKVRIRYTGDELAVIDFLNTVYRESYA